jgi:hypothetical protein
MIEAPAIILTLDVRQRLSQHLKRLLVATFIGLPVGVIYYLRLDDVIGQVRDDAWYVLLAKSLATGQGYELINSPVSGILPSYPPAFPFLLSLVMRLFPLAAEQFWLLKGVSIMAMLAIGGTTYVYLARFFKLPLYLAAAVAVAITTMPAFVFLATSTVMSECVFTLGQLLTVLVVEKGVRQTAQRQQLGHWILAATLAAFTFLVRSVAVTLVAAVVIYLLKERQRKAAVVFAGGTLLLISPWLLYARWHAPTVEQKQLHGGYILYSYGEQFWMKRAGDTESGTETWRDLPARVSRNLYNIIAYDFCGLVFPAALRDATESGGEVLGLGLISGLKRTSMGQVTATRVISLSLAALALIGWIGGVRQRVTLAEIVTLSSLALIIIWPWLTFRFLLPLAPFLLSYILLGLATLARWIKNILPHSDEWALPRMVILCVLAFYLYDHVAYLKHKLTAPESIIWLSEFNDVRATLHWGQTHLPPDAIVATNNPAQFFLYTHRPAITSGDPQQPQWKKLGVRYLVILSSHASTPLDDDPKTYPLLYGASPDHMRVIDLGQTATR